MSRLALATEVVDAKGHASAVARLRNAGVALPTIAQLADPASIPLAMRRRLSRIDPDRPDPANLFRVHWNNDATRTGLDDVPGYLVLPENLTGVAAPIVVALGRRFPMIGAHKVLAAYGCLVPRIVTGQFDPAVHKAIWPSTGNYCRGGVAISRIIGCRGVAVLPEGMSEERFGWLRRWVADPADIVRTPGTESNVKEIYDACRTLERDPGNVIFNQFAEYGNYLVHYVCTVRALERVFDHLRGRHRDLRLAAYTATTGSAGTLGAGDYLKERHGTRIVAVEPTECPTLLANGYGEHNIQGIGDKHVPLIHNVMNTDLVVGVSDRATDALQLLFNDDVGRAYLKTRRGIDAAIVDLLDSFGFSGLANVIAAIKVAKRLDLGADDAVLTVATDSAEMYGSERDKYRAATYADGFDTVHAGEIFSRFLLGVADDSVLELTHSERKRIFNLGYYTWVEQQGVPLDDFDRRRDQAFWRDLRRLVPAWDSLIEDFNARTGITADR